MSDLTFRNIYGHGMCVCVCVDNHPNALPLCDESKGTIPFFGGVLCVNCAAGLDEALQSIPTRSEQDATLNESDVSQQVNPSPESDPA